MLPEAYSTVAWDPSHLTSTWVRLMGGMAGNPKGEGGIGGPESLSACPPPVL